MNVTIYVNDVKVDPEDLGNYEIKSEEALRILERGLMRARQKKLGNPGGAGEAEKTA